MKKLVFISLLLLSSAAISNPKMNVLPSLEWQKNELEMKVHDKLQRGTEVILGHEHFFVDVEIVTNTPETPNFSIPLNPSSEGDTGSIDGNGRKELDLTDDSKQAKAAEDDKTKSDAEIKFTNDVPETDYGESIVFSRLGMEAPLIDDFNDFSPSGKILLTMGDNSKDKINKMKEDFSKEKEKLVDQIKKLRDASKAKPSMIEQMWKYNTSIDIFKNISEINISVRLPNDIAKDERVRIEGLIKSIKLGVNDITPNFKFSYTINVPQKEDIISKSDFLKALSSVSNIIAIVLGVLLIGFVGNRLISKFFELNSAAQAGGNFTMQNDRPESDDDGGAGEMLAAGGGGGDGLGGVHSLNGIERFKVFADNTPQEAILLVKKWIAQDTKSGHAALRALVQQIDNSALTDIFKMLSEPEKAKWRELLNKPLNANELSLANDYISNQIVQSVILPSVIEDPNTYDLLLKLNAEMINQIYEKDPYIVSLVLNALSDSFVAEVLSSCESETVDQILMSSVIIKEQEVRDNQARIKEVLSQYVESKSKLPFVDKLYDILPNVSATVEKSIFNTLKQNINVEEFTELSQKNFPSELVSELPSKFLKEALANYDLGKKVSLLFAMEDSERLYYLDLFAPDGTKARDLMQIEFDSVERDEMRKSKIIAGKDDSWREFVKFVRTRITKEKDEKTEIENLVHNWAQDLYGSVETRPDLKVA
ncbi:hypothetical protein M902_2066 [Bacteriovorax sp. BAL6_X]|uniref:hypothetical protein n=1 Tax=Bacteriovorax sp. BAL6_X TaxID=1201290 RepID=UPI000386C9C9|nr:hypothetical protein [Bacteriovorax sp. BAL6_X]EPZ51719.1 hypothetical protein M902_2066 [Bacteriovorax sp. BAL6_X]